MRPDTIENMDDDPDWTAHLDRMSPDERREHDEMDAGRFRCADCGEYYAPDGGDGHIDCPSLASESYPPGAFR